MSEAAREFLELLHGDAPGHVALGVLSAEGKWADETYGSRQAALAVARSADEHGAQGVYVRVTTTGAAPGGKRRGSAADTVALPGLWADVDFGTVGHKTTERLPPDEAGARKIVETSGLPEPTVWVHSGGGLYPYWLLHTPHVIADNLETMQQITGISEGWQRVIVAAAADLGWTYGPVGDLPRVLRLPGTTNRKDGQERPCHVISSDGPRYTLAELTQAMLDTDRWQEAGGNTTHERGNKDSDDDAVPGDVFDVFARVVGYDEILAPHDWQPSGAVTTCGCPTWTRPGKDHRKGVSAVTHEGCTKFGRSFKCFSDAADPLPYKKNISKAHTWALLTGDERGAYRALSGVSTGERDELPGLGDDAAARIREGCEHYGVSGTGKGGGREYRSQLRMAHRFADENADALRYVHGIGWHIWDGARWADDLDGAATRAAIETIRKAKQEGLGEDAEDCEKSQGLSGMLKIAQSLKPLAVAARDLDADPFLLGTPNGTLDLHTMELRDPDPADLITKTTGTGVDMNAQGETFQRFLEGVLPDPEVRGFTQRLFGHALLGKVYENVFPVPHGPAGTGKSTFLELILDVFGDYGKAVSSTLLLATKHEEHKAELADLRGLRLGIAHETGRGKRLDTETMKRLTGGDEITARFMRQNFFTFKPTHMLAMVTNHKPVVDGDDAAAWDRIRIIPFEQRFRHTEGEDTRLKDKLALEMPAVLRWLIEGYHAYTQRGLDAPDAVKVATEEYREESDVIGAFLTACCDQGSEHTHSVRASEVFKAWREWCEENRERPGSEKAFAERLKQRGIPKKRQPGTGRQMYLGVELSLFDEATNRGDEEAHTGGVKGCEGFSDTRYAHTRARTGDDSSENPSQPFTEAPAGTCADGTCGHTECQRRPDRIPCARCAQPMTVIFEGQTAHPGCETEAGRKDTAA